MAHFSVFSVLISLDLNGVSNLSVQQMIWDWAAIDDHNQYSYLRYNAIDVMTSRGSKRSDGSIPGYAAPNMVWLYPRSPLAVAAAAAAPPRQQPHLNTTPSSPTTCSALVTKMVCPGFPSAIHRSMRHGLCQLL